LGAPAPCSSQIHDLPLARSDRWEPSRDCGLSSVGGARGRHVTERDSANLWRCLRPGPICEYLGTLYSDGFSPKHILAIVQAVLDLRTSVEPLSHILEVIVSGPEVLGLPVGDTFSAMHTLVQAAAREVIVAGYPIYNGKTVFRSLAERMDSIPDLHVTFLVHIGREGKDDSRDGSSRTICQAVRVG
jgi:hypothetical protein